MKIKSVLAAFAATAVLSATAVTAFAETDENDKDAMAATGINGGVVDTVADTATVDGTEKSDNTGAEGVAAILGVVALAGAAVVMSRKKA